MKRKALSLKAVIMGITVLSALMTLIVMFANHVVSSAIAAIMIFAVHAMLNGED